MSLWTEEMALQKLMQSERHEIDFDLRDAEPEVPWFDIRDSQTVGRRTVSKASKAKSRAANKAARKARKRNRA